MEGYIEKEEEDLKEEACEEDDVFDSGTVTFRDRSLAEWEEFLTVRMPVMPATSTQLSTVLAGINDKYQIAYNCHNDLSVMAKGVEIKFKKKLNIALETVRASLKQQGVNRVPAMDTLEVMALKGNQELIDLKDKLEIYEVIKEWFDKNRNKLGTIIKSTSDLLFAANHSDRMFQKTERTGGF
jgi:hypothetical protein